ncbi:MAG: RNA 2',3'-cyclic phosphodiesterase [Chloroflexi bacterium]|nr:RNA 2',3'-cyclic phosphodiesterase [Chloroflexota bacterium]
MPRIFVAIPLPADVASALDRLLPPLPSLRRVAPELMHVTLAFVGQVAEEHVRVVIDSAKVAARSHGPFDVELNAVGRFPEHGRPRIVWVGTDARTADAIVGLGASVRAELLRHRVRFDPKPLRAHVTLARVRDDAGDDDARAISSALARACVDGALRFTAASLHVMESKLSATGPPGRIRGPLYSSREEVPLAGPPR